MAGKSKAIGRIQDFVVRIQATVRIVLHVVGRLLKDIDITILVVLISIEQLGHYSLFEPSCIPFCFDLGST